MCRVAADRGRKEFKSSLMTRLPVYRYPSHLVKGVAFDASMPLWRIRYNLNVLGGTVVPTWAAEMWKDLFAPSGQIWRKSASAVDEGNNDGPTLLKIIDHAVVSDQKFANVFDADFRNDSASRRELSQRSCRIASLLDKSSSVSARVSRNETGCALEFLPGGICPDYPASQPSIRLSTSS
jgi:hypothetical protein